MTNQNNATVAQASVRMDIKNEWAAFEKWFLSQFGRRPVPFRREDTCRQEGWMARAALASAPAVGKARPAPGHFKPPFDNCSFRECDLPGQCRGEGRCHHPAAHAAPQAALSAQPGAQKEGNNA